MQSKGRKKSSYAPHSVRFATPFTIKCTKCGEYIVKNKRHNALKEVAVGEAFHDVQSFRFYIKCVNCKITMSIKTKPEWGEYVTEIGCVRVDKAQSEILESKESARDSIIEYEKELEALKKDVYSIMDSENYL